MYVVRLLEPMCIIIEKLHNDYEGEYFVIKNIYDIARKHS